MTDTLLLVLVLGVIAIAVIVDVGALATWMHSRWRASR
jgi:Flp pilus assembly pilin Flp